ncbi:unnamed protein product, partial [Amoebophrya sp. A25]
KASEEVDGLFELPRALLGVWVLPNAELHYWLGIGTTDRLKGKKCFYVYKPNRLSQVRPRQIRQTRNTWARRRHIAKYYADLSQEVGSQAHKAELQKAKAIFDGKTFPFEDDSCISSSQSTDSICPEVNTTHQKQMYNTSVGGPVRT